MILYIRLSLASTQQMRNDLSRLSSMENQKSSPSDLVRSRDAIRREYDHCLESASQNISEQVSDREKTAYDRKLNYLATVIG